MSRRPPRPSAAAAPTARPAPRRRGRAADDASPAEPPAAALTSAALTGSALDSIRRIVRALRVGARSVESRTGLSAAQLFTLQLVAAAPGRSLTELAERTMTDRTSAAGMVDRLVERRLVERRAGTGDRRRIEIFVTRRGHTVLARAPQAPTQRVLDGLAAMPEPELRQLTRSLGALVRAMDLEREPVVMLFEDAAPVAQPAAARTRVPRPTTSRGA